MKVFLTSTGQNVTLPATPAGRGGYGKAYRVGKIAVKIIQPDARTLEFIARIDALIHWHEKDLHFALPTGLVLDRPGGEEIGFTMPWFDGVPLLCVYDGTAADKHKVSFTPLERLQIAGTLAQRVDTAHEHDLVIGDLNPTNILVRRGGMFSRPEIFVIDCDSFEFSARDKTGMHRRFRCGVGQEPFLAPELQGKKLRQVDRTEETDNYALAELIWQILKGGAHSHAVHASSAVPPLGEFIKEGLWCYAPSRPIPPDWHRVDEGILWRAIPKDIREKFNRTFHDGFADPKKRATARELADSLAAWEHQERHLASTARRIIGAITALAVASATTWLIDRMKRLQDIFGWAEKPTTKDVRHKGLVRVAIIGLLIALAFYAAATERAERKESPTAHPILPEWGKKRNNPEEQKGRWQGAPKQWKELVDECEREGK